MDENEYSPCEEQADSLSSQSKSREGSGKFRSFENGNNDFPSLLNVPLGSDGQGSHDSHNDSGYSTRFGYSAGPSPSLSGTYLFHHSVNNHKEIQGKSLSKWHLGPKVNKIFL